MEFYIYDSMIEMWLTPKGDTYTSRINEAGRFGCVRATRIVTELNSFMGGSMDTQMQPIERRKLLRAA